MANGINSLSQNIFREEVDDDIIFDLDTTFQGQTVSAEAPKVKASPGASAPNFGIDLNFLKNIKAPKIEGPNIQGPDINLGVDLSPGVAIPSVDLNTPDIPSVDVNVPNIDLQPAIDVAGSVLGKASETVSDLAQPIIDPVLEAGGDLLNVVGDSFSTVTDAIGSVTEPIGSIIKETVSGAGDALGVAEDIFKDSKIKKGDGSGYGEIGIGNTGTVLDVSATLDSTFADVTKGTVMEGISGQDLFDITTNPADFAAKKGGEIATDVLTKNLGMDNELAGDVVSAISDPEQFIVDKGIEKATDFISKATGINIDSGVISELLDSGNIAKAAQKAAEAAAKRAATETTIKVVSTAANAIVPGSGALIEAAARLFNYSCYLSTSAYHYGYISRDEYFQFTHYRIKIQSKEFLSTVVWLGYINLFEKPYSELIHNEKKASFIFKTITNPWLSHVRYLLGKGPFSIKGFIVTQALRVACIGAYLFNYRACEKRKKSLDGINVINIYKRLVSIVEKERKKCLV